MAQFQTYYKIVDPVSTFSQINDYWGNGGSSFCESISGNGTVTVHQMQDASLAQLMIYIQETDDNGNVLWSKRYSWQSYGNPMAIKPVGSLGYAIVGSDQLNGLPRGIVIFIDPSGNIQWSRYFGDFITYCVFTDLVFLPGPGEIHALGSRVAGPKSVVARYNLQGDFLSADEYQLNIPGSGYPFGFLMHSTPPRAVVYDQNKYMVLNSASTGIQAGIPMSETRLVLSRWDESGLIQGTTYRRDPQPFNGGLNISGYSLKLGPNGEFVIGGRASGDGGTNLFKSAGFVMVVEPTDDVRWARTYEFVGTQEFGLTDIDYANNEFYITGWESNSTGSIFRPYYGLLDNSGVPSYLEYHGNINSSINRLYRNVYFSQNLGEVFLSGKSRLNTNDRNIFLTRTSTSGGVVDCFTPFNIPSEDIEITVKDEIIDVDPLSTSFIAAFSSTSETVSTLECTDLAPRRTNPDLGTKLSIYPNPVSRKLWIDSKDEPILSLKLMDLNGRTLESYSYGDGPEKLALSVEGLSSGIYMLQIETEVGSKTEKLVVK